MGVWIDYEKAIIVDIIGNTKRVKHVESGISGHVHLSRAFAPTASDGQQDYSPGMRIYESHKNRLHKYYKKIIHEIEDADRIFIFGPDGARLELKKELRKSKERIHKVASVERSGWMDEFHIMAKMKQFQTLGRTHLKKQAS